MQHVTVFYSYYIIVYVKMGHVILSVCPFLSFREHDLRFTAAEHISQVTF